MTASEQWTAVNQLATVLGELVAQAATIPEDYLATRLAPAIPRDVFDRLVAHQVAAGRVIRENGWLHGVER